MRTELLTALVFSLALLVAIFLFRPSLRQLRETSKAISEKRTEVATKEARLNFIREIQRDLGTFEAALKTADLALPPQPKLEFLLPELEAQVEQSGLKLIALTPTTGTPAGPIPGGAEIGGLGTVLVSLSVSGEAANLLRLLETLEMSVRPVTIDTLSVAAGSEGAVTASITLTAFFSGGSP